MKVPAIIGADISKKTIDFSTVEADHLRISNDQSGFKEMIRWLAFLKITGTEVVIVMEHTGLYSYRLEKFLHARKIAFSKVPAIAIKRSLGMVRGKNDKIDAKRIARFGFEKRDQLVICKENPVILQQLHDLHITRDRLVKHRAALVVAVKQYRENLGMKNTDLIVKSQQRLIDDFKIEIGKITNAIKKLLESDPVIDQNYQLLCSIKGVGMVLAVGVIIKTKNFTSFSDARKFACFCGVAPFENTSGSSIRGRTRVSHLADKYMKTLLDLAAKSAIRYDPELNAFYSRKVKEGKSKMTVINVVRNKIIYRMFAVIKRQTPYIDNYPAAA